MLVALISMTFILGAVCGALAIIAICLYIADRDDMRDAVRTHTEDQTMDLANPPGTILNYDKS